MGIVNTILNAGRHGRQRKLDNIRRWVYSEDGAHELKTAAEVELRSLSYGRENTPAQKAMGPLAVQAILGMEDGNHILLELLHYGESGLSNPEQFAHGIASLPPASLRDAIETVKQQIARYAEQDFSAMKPSYPELQGYENLDIAIIFEAMNFIEEQHEKHCQRLR